MRKYGPMVCESDIDVAKAMAFEFLLRHKKTPEIEKIFDKMNAIAHSMEFDTLTSAIKYAQYVDIED